MNLDPAPGQVESAGKQSQWSYASIQHDNGPVRLKRWSRSVTIRLPSVVGRSRRPPGPKSPVDDDRASTLFTEANFRKKNLAREAIFTVS
jgi:hypothetical protein